MKSLNEILNKIISSTLVVMMTVSFHAEAFAASGMPVVSVNSNAKELEMPFQSLAAEFDLAHGLGTIKKRHMAVSDSSPQHYAPVIIHVQDAHGNEEAQHNIKKILSHLNSDYGVDVFFLEGGMGPLTAEALRFFNDNEESNQRVAEQLMREGLIGGTELFHLEHTSKALHDNIHVYGVENPELYREGLTSYRDVMKNEKVAEVFLTQLKLTVLTLGSHVFNKTLKSFFREWLSYQDAPSDLIRQFSILKKYASKELDMDLSDARMQVEWPQLVRFMKLQELSEKWNKEEAEVEHAQLLAWMQEKEFGASSIEIMTSILKENHFNHKSFTGPRDFLEKFYDVAKAHEFSFEAYPNLSVALGHLVLRNEIEAQQLFDELSRLTDRILKTLAKTREEKMLVSLFKDYLLLKKLFSLTLIFEEFEEMKDRHDSMAPSRIALKLQALVDYLNVKRNLKLKSSIKAVPDQLFSRAMAFYGVARAREDAIFENMVLRMKKHKKAHAVLVSGGFHAQGMERFFETNNVSYVQVMPKISSIESLQDHDNYMNTMMLEGDYLSRRSYNMTATPTEAGSMVTLTAWDGDVAAHYMGTQVAVVGTEVHHLSQTGEFSSVVATMTDSPAAINGNITATISGDDVATVTVAGNPVEHSAQPGSYFVLTSDGAATANEAGVVFRSEARHTSQPSVDFIPPDIIFSRFSQLDEDFEDKDREFLAFTPSTDDKIAVTLKVDGENIASKTLNHNGETVEELSSRASYDRADYDSYEQTVERLLLDEERKRRGAKSRDDIVGELKDQTLSRMVNQIGALITKVVEQKGGSVETHADVIAALEFIETIGISTPGPLAEGGVNGEGIFASQSPNLPFPEGMNLRNELAQKLAEQFRDVNIDQEIFVEKISVQHDAVAGGLGEMSRHGTVKNQDSALYLLWGNGVGASLHIEGELQTGGQEINHLLGEVGHHMVWFPETQSYEWVGQWASGRQHHQTDAYWSKYQDAEDRLSLPNILNRLNKDGLEDLLDPEEIVKIGLEMGRMLGSYIKSIRAEYGRDSVPDNIVIGSEFSQLVVYHPYLLNAVQEGFYEELSRPVQSELGYQHGIIGRHARELSDVVAGKELSSLQTLDAWRTHLSENYGKLYANNYIEAIFAAEKPNDEFKAVQKRLNINEVNKRKVKNLLRKDGIQFDTGAIIGDALSLIDNYQYEMAIAKINEAIDVIESVSKTDKRLKNYRAAIDLLKKIDDNFREEGPTVETDFRKWKTPFDTLGPKRNKWLQIVESLYEFYEIIDGELAPELRTDPTAASHQAKQSRRLLIASEEDVKMFEARGITVHRGPYAGPQPYKDRDTGHQKVKVGYLDVGQAFEEIYEDIKVKKNKKGKPNALVFSGGSGAPRVIAPIVQDSAYDDPERLIVPLLTNTDDGGSTRAIVDALIDAGFGVTPPLGDTVNALFTTFLEPEKLDDILDDGGRIRDNFDQSVLWHVERMLENSRQKYKEEKGDKFDDAGFESFSDTMKRLAKYMDDHVDFWSGEDGDTPPAQRPGVLLLKKKKASIRNLIFLAKLMETGVFEAIYEPGDNKSNALETPGKQKAFQKALDELRDELGIKDGGASISSYTPATMYARYEENILSFDDDGVDRTVAIKVQDNEVVIVRDATEADREKEINISIGQEEELYGVKIGNEKGPDGVVRPYIKIGGDLRYIVEEDGGNVTYLQSPNASSSRIKIANDGTGRAQEDVDRNKKTEKGITVGGKTIYLRSRLIIQQTSITETANFSKITELGTLEFMSTDPNKKIIQKSNPEAVKLVEGTTDMIVMGPGSFHTSLMPHFFSPDIVKALIKNKGGAKRIFVFNPNRDNETMRLSIEDMMKLIEDIVNTTLSEDPEFLAEYGGKIQFEHLFDDVILNQGIARNFMKLGEEQVKKKRKKRTEKKVTEEESKFPDPDSLTLTREGSKGIKVTWGKEVFYIKDSKDKIGKTFAKALRDRGFNTDGLKARGYADGWVRVETPHYTYDFRVAGGLKMAENYIKEALAEARSEVRQIPIEDMVALEDYLDKRADLSAHGSTGQRTWNRGDSIVVRRDGTGVGQGTYTFTLRTKEKEMKLILSQHYSTDGPFKFEGRLTANGFDHTLNIKIASIEVSALGAALHFDFEISYASPGAVKNWQSTVVDQLADGLEQLTLVSEGATPLDATASIKVRSEARDLTRRQFLVRSASAAVVVFPTLEALGQDVVIEATSEEDILRPSISWQDEEKLIEIIKDHTATAADRRDAAEKLHNIVHFKVAQGIAVDAAVEGLIAGTRTSDNLLNALTEDARNLGEDITEADNQRIGTAKNADMHVMVAMANALVAAKKAAVKPIIREFEKQDTGVHTYFNLINVVKDLKATDAVPVLGRLLTSPRFSQERIEKQEIDEGYHYVKLEIAKALGALGDVRGIRPLVRALETEPQEDLRLSAIVNLGNIGEANQSRNYPSREVAEAALFAAWVEHQLGVVAEGEIAALLRKYDRSKEVEHVFIPAIRKAFEQFQNGLYLELIEKFDTLRVLPPFYEDNQSVFKKWRYAVQQVSNLASVGSPELKKFTEKTLMEALTEVETLIGKARRGEEFDNKKLIHRILSSAKEVLEEGLETVRSEARLDVVKSVSNLWSRATQFVNRSVDIALGERGGFSPTRHVDKIGFEVEEARTPLAVDGASAAGGFLPLDGEVDDRLSTVPVLVGSAVAGSAGAGAFGFPGGRDSQALRFAAIGEGEASDSVPVIEPQKDHEDINVVPAELDFFGDVHLVSSEFTADSRTTRGPGSIDIQFNTDPNASARDESNGFDFGGINFVTAQPLQGDFTFSTEIIAGADTLDNMDGVTLIEIFDSEGDRLKTELITTTASEKVYSIDAGLLASAGIDDVKTFLITIEDRNLGDGVVVEGTLRVHVRATPLQIFEPSLLANDTELTSFNIWSAITLGTQDESRRTEVDLERGLVRGDVDAFAEGDLEGFAGIGVQIAGDVEIGGDHVHVEVVSTAGEQLQLEFNTVNEADQRHSVKVRIDKNAANGRPYSIPREAFERVGANPEDITNIIVISAEHLEGAQPGTIQLLVSPRSPFDVNKDGQVTPLDVLIGINNANNGLGGPLAPVGTTEYYATYQFDVSGDGVRDTPLDILFVINAINQAVAALPEAEGEASDSVPVIEPQKDHEDINVVPAELDFFGDVHLVSSEFTADSRTTRGPGSIDIQFNTDPNASARDESNGFDFGGINFVTAQPLQGDFTFSTEIIAGADTLDNMDGVTLIEIFDSEGDRLKTELITTTASEKVYSIDAGLLASAGIDDVKTFLITIEDRNLGDGVVVEGTLRVHVRATPLQIFEPSLLANDTELTSFNIWSAITLGTQDESRRTEVDLERGLVRGDVDAFAEGDLEGFAGIGVQIAGDVEIGGDHVHVEVVSTAGEQLQLEFNTVNEADQRHSVKVRIDKNAANGRPYSIPREAFERVGANPEDITNIIVISAEHLEGAQPGTIQLLVSPRSPFDVNKDGQVTPLDVLIGINNANNGLGGPLAPVGTTEYYATYQFDVSGDGVRDTPLDILFVINAINQAVAALPEAEGEAEPTIVGAGFDTSTRIDDSLITTTTAALGRAEGDSSLVVAPSQTTEEEVVSFTTATTSQDALPLQATDSIALPEETTILIEAVEGDDLVVSSTWSIDSQVSTVTVAGDVDGAGIVDTLSSTLPTGPDASQVVTSSTILLEDVAAPVTDEQRRQRIADDVFGDLADETPGVESELDLLAEDQVGGDPLLDDLFDLDTDGDVLLGSRGDGLIGELARDRRAALGRNLLGSRAEARFTATLPSELATAESDRNFLETTLQDSRYGASLDAILHVSEHVAAETLPLLFSGDLVDRLLNLLESPRGQRTIQLQNLEQLRAIVAEELEDYAFLAGRDSGVPPIGLVLPVRANTNPNTLRVLLSVLANEQDSISLLLQSDDETAVEAFNEGLEESLSQVAPEDVASRITSYGLNDRGLVSSVMQVLNSRVDRDVTRGVAHYHETVNQLVVSRHYHVMEAGEEINEIVAGMLAAAYLREAVLLNERSYEIASLIAWLNAKGIDGEQLSLRVARVLKRIQSAKFVDVAA